MITIISIIEIDDSRTTIAYDRFYIREVIHRAVNKYVGESISLDMSYSVKTSIKEISK